MYLPDWIQKYKEPRTEIKRIKNAYYKYEVALLSSYQREYYRCKIHVTVYERNEYQRESHICC